MNVADFKSELRSEGLTLAVQLQPDQPFTIGGFIEALSHEDIAHCMELKIYPVVGVLATLDGKTVAFGHERIPATATVLKHGWIFGDW